MEISLIASPYDLGQEGEGKALGPSRYLEAGAEDLLADKGFKVEARTVERPGPFEDEPGAVAGVNARVAERVGEDVAGGAFPFVLGGSCDTALGVLAGLGSSRTGIVWFDAHGDFNTPQTSPSGYLGGMPLAIATGHCHRRLWAGVGGAVPIQESGVLMVGVRDLDPEEASLLDDSGISVVAAAEIGSRGVEESLREPLERLGSRVEKVYLHLDIDCLDPRFAPGVGFPTPDGLSVRDAEEAISNVSRRVGIGAVGLTAYDPERDEDGRTLRAGMRLIGAVAEAVAGSETGVRRGR